MKNDNKQAREQTFYRFFYDTQHKRMLNIGYLLLTKEGVAWALFVLVCFYFGLYSFFLLAFYAAIFMYLYFKKFNATLEDRENLYLYRLVRKYLGIKDTEL